MPLSQNESSTHPQDFFTSSYGSNYASSHGTSYEQSAKGGFLARLCFRLAAKMLPDTEGDLVLPRRGCARLLRWSAQLGNVPAMRLLGFLLCQHGACRKDKRRGVEYLQSAAKEHDLDAQYSLARLYRHGVDYMKKDERLSLKWISLAAEGGHLDAQRDLADAYLKGELGLPKNPSKAAALTRKIEQAVA